MSEIMTREVATAILDMLRQAAQASIFEGNTQKPFAIQAVTLDLTTASTLQNPFKVGFPFRSVYVSAATDVNTTLNLQPNSNDSFQSVMPLRQNDSWSATYPIAQAYLNWTAQPGKSITLLFFTDSDFKSGSQISVTSGGVSIVEGTSFTQTMVNFSGGGNAQIVAADSTRKQATLLNKSPNSIWVGNASVSNTGVNIGHEVLPGSVFIWRNTAAIYGYSALATTGDNGVHLTLEY